MIRTADVPSDRFIHNCKDFAAKKATLEEAYWQDRWRRRLWWTLNGIVVPAVLVPLAIFGVGASSFARPPDVPSLFAVLFVMSISCWRGGVIGGGVALGGTAVLVAWGMRYYPLTDYNLWLWFILALLGYASVLALLYFRAPDRDPWVPPGSGSASFRKPLGVRRLRRRQRGDKQSTHRRYKLEQRPASLLSARISGILQ